MAMPQDAIGWPVPLLRRPPSRVLRHSAHQLGDLLVDLRHSLASKGGGVDREPATVLRDLDDLAVHLGELASVLALDEEP